MPNAVRTFPALLLLAAISATGCAHPRVQTGPRFAGLNGVEVRVLSDLPDSVAAPRTLRPPQLRQGVIERMERVRVPVIRDDRPLDSGKAGLELELASMAVGPGDYAVWVRVSLAELTRFDRGSSDPLMVSTWSRSGTARIRGNDTTPLWRQIDLLTREFAEAYHEANPARRNTASAPAGSR
ncbi:MAG TPA: hypothetical protein VFJ16_13015 [Longimicrobium sp.]|nr:hypothetical protein [Longimicrobium sp.]